MTQVLTFHVQNKLSYSWSNKEWKAVLMINIKVIKL